MMQVEIVEMAGPAGRTWVLSTDVARREAEGWSLVDTAPTATPEPEMEAEPEGEDDGADR